MHVTIKHAPLPGLPLPTGPHELAWSYVLDAVFSDAYHAGIGHLQVTLPFENLVPAVEVRAQLSRGMRPSAANATADLSGSLSQVTDATRVYLLGFGALAPRALRSIARCQTTGLTLVGHLSCLTPAARLWGIPIRLAQAMKREDLVDRSMAAMRRSFASERDPHAYYQLNVWGKA